MTKLTLEQVIQRVLQATKNYVDGKAGNPVVKLTQAKYDALSTKDPNTIYLIIG